MSRTKYRRAALGGTFDRFHRGHERLLTKALELADEILIGVTTQELNRHKILAQIILPYEERAHELTAYLTNHYPGRQIKIFPLTDPYGLSIVDPAIDLVVVSPLTLSGAKAINRLRRAKALSPVAIEVAEMVNDVSGEYLSSTRIRQGLVNRQGFVYQKLFNHDLILSANQKNLIAKPQGEFIDPNRLTAKSLTVYPVIALVGDQVTETFIQKGMPFTVAVIDYRNERRPYSTDLGKVNFNYRFKLTNPPGVIATEAAQAMYKLPPEQPVLVEVNGEEDLLGFPLSLCLPLGSALFYGQAGQGLVMMVLTETKKEALRQLL